MWLASLLVLLQPHVTGLASNLNISSKTTNGYEYQLTTVSWLVDERTNSERPGPEPWPGPGPRTELDNESSNDTSTGPISSLPSMDYNSSHLTHNEDSPSNGNTTTPSLYTGLGVSPIAGKDITFPMHSGRKHVKNSSNITIIPSHKLSNHRVWPPLQVMWDDQGRDQTRPTRKPFFRPQSALSRNYRNFRLEPELMDACWPHCKNTTINKHYVHNKKRRRHHSSSRRRKYYNYKRLYDTLKHQEENMQKQETQFYAWIFGATMLSLAALATLTSCLVFCLCSDKWKKRKRTKHFDKSGEYQRVDSISSMVDQPEHHETVDQVDSVTII